MWNRLAIGWWMETKCGSLFFQLSTQDYGIFASNPNYAKLALIGIYNGSLSITLAVLLSDEFFISFR